MVPANELSQWPNEASSGRDRSKLGISETGRWDRTSAVSLILFLSRPGVAAAFYLQGQCQLAQSLAPLIYKDFSLRQTAELMDFQKPGSGPSGFP
jgi:hypothetical protein